MKPTYCKQTPRKHERAPLPACVLSVAWLLCLAFFPSLHAQQGNATWKLECDTRIPLHDRGKIVGATRIVAGSVLDVQPPGRENIGKNVVRLRYMNEVFLMPTGPDLQAILAKQNPSGTPAEKQVLDLHVLKVEEQVAKRKQGRSSAVPEEELPATYITEAITMELPADSPAEIPEGFAWDRTVIIPGKFGFLKLPFIKQTKPGICVAAASINAICHLHPDIQLRGSELFRLYNNRTGGASFHEASFGNLQLGVKCRMMRTAGMSLHKLVDMIHQSIEANLPVIAADQRHALLIYGFDKEAKKLFVWNQWGNGKIVNGMPKGTYLLQESDLAIEFTDLLFVSKVRFKPLETLRETLEAKVGAAEDLQVHPVVGSPFGGIQHYLPYSAQQRIKAYLRAGRTILILQGEEVLCVFPDEVKAETASLQCRSMPSGKMERHTLESLTPLLLPVRGEFYSVRHAEKLPPRKEGKQTVNNDQAADSVN